MSKICLSKGPTRIHLEVLSITHSRKLDGLHDIIYYLDKQVFRQVEQEHCIKLSNKDRDLGEGQNP